MTAYFTPGKRQFLIKQRKHSIPKSVYIVTLINTVDVPTKYYMWWKNTNSKAFYYITIFINPFMTKYSKFSGHFVSQWLKLLFFLSTVCIMLFL